MRIVGKANASTPLLPSGDIEGALTEGTRYLNTTGKDILFLAAHANTVRQMQRDNDRGSEYHPSPTVGPVVPLCTTFLLTITLSTGDFFHRWRRNRGLRRTLPRPARRHPCAGQRG